MIKYCWGTKSLPLFLAGALCVSAPSAQLFLAPKRREMATVGAKTNDTL